jgi:hypothetical protein
MLKEVTLKLPDWAYQYFVDKWPENKRSEDKEFNLEWYVSWKVSEMVSDELEETRRSTGADKGIVPAQDKTTRRSVHVHP